VDLVRLVVGAGWAGAGNGHTPTGTESSSALLAVLITAGVLLWGRLIERERARKMLPFRRIVMP